MVGVFDCRYDMNVQMRIPLLMVDADKKFQRLESRVEECCYKIFSYIFLANPDVPCRGFLLGRPEIVFAVVEHVPHWLSMHEPFGFQWSNVKVSVAAVLVTSFAGRSERYKSKKCLQAVECIMDLPSTLSRGDAFYSEVETAGDAVVVANDKRFLQSVRNVMAEHKKRSEAWERRSHWIHACIQIGLHSK